VQKYIIIIAEDPMKRTVSFALIILISILASSCKKEQKVAREGIVNFMNGEVHLIVGGKKSAAKVGEVITQGMKIITGDKSFVDIYFGENAVKVLSNTVIEIKQLIVNMENNSEETELLIEKGQAFSKISKKLSKNDSYKVRTPTTIAAIRGTDFLVSEENGKGKVSCLDGKVAVRDATVKDSREVELNAGEEVEVEPGKDLSVRGISESSKKDIKRILNDIREMRKDIRKRFEEEREAIRKQVVEQKEKNREMVQKLKDENKERIEDQKALDKANIEAIKGKTDEGKKEAEKDIEKSREESRKALEGVKPEIKKFSVDIKKPEIKKPENK